MIAIEAHNVGKRYSLHLRNEPYRALRDDIVNAFRWFTKGRNKRHDADEFWALRDIDFSVQQGEVLGIIGPNGSGKSTLLKILSRITPPTTGEVKIRGRVGSLLEVGTGFHPELSGRENIFLNGAILGMEKKEIVRKMDEIVAFSGIEKFLDTPVKYYSSGMYVRLAFSVAAHMDPDILLVDEVLAVGDAEFQKKCIGKMEEITQKQGRTILFVSHNMTAVQELCSRTLLLKAGRVVADGSTKEVVGAYLNEVLLSGEGELALPENTHAEMTFSKIWMTDEAGTVTNEFNRTRGFTIHVSCKVVHPLEQTEISISFKNSRNTDIVFSSLSDTRNGQLRSFQPGIYQFSVKFPGGILMPDHYYVRISAHQPGIRDIDLREDVIGFRVIEAAGSRPVNYGLGCVTIPSQWHEE